MNTVPTSAQRVALDLLRLDRRVFPRFKVDAERRRVFAELYQDGGAEALPPILVVTEPETGKYLVADGFTRVFAAADAELVYVLADLPPVRGDATPIENAYEIGLRQVAISGKPLSRAEQHEAILRVLDEHPDWSDAEIARLVGVVRQTVWRQRPVHTIANQGDPVRVDRYQLGRRGCRVHCHTK